MFKFTVFFCVCCVPCKGKRDKLLKSGWPTFYCEKGRQTFKVKLVICNGWFVIMTIFLFRKLLFRCSWYLSLKFGFARKSSSYFKAVNEIILLDTDIKLQPFIPPVKTASPPQCITYTLTSKR